MDQIDSRQRLRRRPGQQFGGIAGEQPDVADVVSFDLRQDFRHAVDVGLAADEAGIGKGERFGDKMLAAAEADLEPDIVDGGSNSPARSAGRGRDVERKPRQQMIDQVGLVLAQLVALAPPEERAVPVRGRVVAGRAIMIVGIAGCDAHRSVWYSRWNSRARGSIDEMYSCS